MSSLLHRSRFANVASAVAWHALLKTADKQAIRADLPAGSHHTVNLAISGDVDGEPFDQSFSAILSVGVDSTRATSATPSLEKIVGAILGKLNERTREAILRDLPEDFAANGCDLPEVPEAIAEKASAMLSRLRAKKSVDVRGSVSCKPVIESRPAERKFEFAVVG